jgi:hypothetical protein
MSINLTALVPSSIFEAGSKLNLPEKDGFRVARYDLENVSSLGYKTTIECLEKKRSQHSVSQFRFESPILKSQDNQLYIDRMVSVLVSDELIEVSDNIGGITHLNYSAFCPKFLQESEGNTILRVVSTTPVASESGGAKEGSTKAIAIMKEQDLFQPTNVKMYRSALQFQYNAIEAVFHASIATSVPKDVLDICSAKLVDLQNEIFRVEGKFDALLRYR